MPSSTEGGMKIGDRVYILGDNHPWKSSVGVIVAPFEVPGFDWTVELDGGAYPGHQVATSEDELRLLDKTGSLVDP